MKPQSKQEKLTDLQDQIRKCRICRETFGFEPHPIVQGNYGAKIMQISQAPSKTVHQTGKPFNDASGKKLRGEWYQIPDEMFYDPQNFYIVSAAHCYPGSAPGKGDRRPPKICAELWLSREIELVDPELYILIGSYAAAYFFPKEKISSLVFEDREILGKPAFILPHPSPLNVKWFLDHPEFSEKRMPQIREIVHRVLGI